MSDVEIRLEREDLEGVVAVGTYLGDAIKRLGGSLDDVCVAGQPHCCAVRILEGAEYLSTPTKNEREYLEGADASSDERLACHVKIERPGRVVIMTKEKKGSEKPEEDQAEKYRKEFAEMPLEKKIANLVQLEAMTIGETISFVINSPFKIADKVMDVMAEFGLKLDKNSKDANRPAEHKNGTNGSAEKKSTDASDTKRASKDKG